MTGFFKYVFIAFIFSTAVGAYKSLGYDDARYAVLNAEEKIMTGGNILLTPKEMIVNKLLMNAKAEENAKWNKTPHQYPPAAHFFKAKSSIESSPVFKFIKEMPKGALLHGHNTAMVSSNWVIKNMTYRPNMLKCVDNAGVVIMTFRRTVEHNCATYVTIQEERLKAPDARVYDKELEKFINLYTPTPETDYPFINDVWQKFENMFTTIGDAIRYLPVYRDYHNQLLEEAYEDGIIYIELRTSFPMGYDEFGNYSSARMVEVLREVVDDFGKTHPNFLGVKIIFSTSRYNERKILQHRISDFNKLRLSHRDFIVGFDLVGQEDEGQPLSNFIMELKTLPEDTKLFFHAGETNWHGSTDLNLLDAILMNTSRIGHGYALVKHPVLWNAVKKKQIAIEVNPISNQVLHLVWDMRNHPAAFFLSQNLPVVISNDDPGFWDAQGLSYDLYYAFMAFAPTSAGLKTLKQLVWNSIKYSAMEPHEKRKASIVFQKMWDEFLDKVIKKTKT